MVLAFILIVIAPESTFCPIGTLIALVSTLAIDGCEPVRLLAVGTGKIPRVVASGRTKCRPPAWVFEPNSINEVIVVVDLIELINVLVALIELINVLATLWIEVASHLLSPSSGFSAVSCTGGRSARAYLRIAGYSSRVKASPGGLVRRVWEL
jgi:hypothetical protein